ncbi:MAG: glycosyltransferase family 9 protein [Puniceicoccales bacterium]|jgi:ADP-heptose:LPS heptosyltransferase|nr:glycosyltransferase family 9 protein [Puniceicoccales bacterium]
MHILVIKPSSLGDVVHGLQVVAIMKKHIKNLRIDWVIRDCFADVVTSSRLVDRILLFRRRAGILAFFKLLKAIRERSYDAVLDMQGLARSGFMTFAARSLRKIGRCNSREMSRIFYNEKIVQSDSPHAIDILLQFLPKFGLNPQFEHALNFYTDENFHRPDGPYVLLFPESRRAEKQWPFFYKLAENLADAYPQLQIVLAGQNSVNWSLSKKNIVNLLGKTRLADILGLVKHCELVVANDSAPIHIGAALRKKIVALFGPTDFQKYGPYPVQYGRHIILAKRDLKDLPVADVSNACALQIDNFLHRC